MLRYASRYFALAMLRQQSYNIIPFYSVTIFQTKKQKMFRYPHIINIVIHIFISFVSRTTLFSTNLHDVLISCKSRFVCGCKHMHNTWRAVVVAHVQKCAKYHSAKADSRKSTHYLKSACAVNDTIEQNICFAKICEAEFSKTHILRNTAKVVVQQKKPYHSARVLWCGSV